MRILKTAVGSDDGTIYTADTIEYDGGLWIVPEWLEAPSEGWTKPARIIRIDILPHQRLERPIGPHHIILNGPIPKAVLDGRTPPQEARGFVVIEGPDITIQAGGSGPH